MAKIAWFLLAAATAAAVLHLLARLARRRACRQGAAKIHRELTAMFSGEHAFRVVSSEEARRGEGPEEDHLRAELRRAGFQLLGWIEDLTVSSVYPHLRTFAECHATAGGRTCATILRLAGLRLFDLTTRFAGDRFLLTTNAEVNKLRPPPSTEKETLPYGTPFADLYARHLERLDARRGGAGRILPCRHLDDALAAARLYSRQASEHRRSCGLLTEEELMEMGAGAGAQREAVARLIWREFRRLQAGDRRAA